MEENNCNLTYLIAHALTSKSTSYDDKLNVIEDLKSVLSGSKTLEVHLELLYKTPILLSGKHGKNFLFSYGNSLVDFLKREPEIDSKILEQLEAVLYELEKQDDKLLEMLVENLWGRMEATSAFFPEFISRIMTYSKKFSERVVLDWVEGIISTSEIDYLVHLSSSLPQLFQAITAIFYQVVIRSQGNFGVLELTRLFVISVKVVCDKEQKDFLRLYPIDCHCLVSLMMVPAEIYSNEECEKLVTKNLVGRMLADFFINDRKRTLLLLSNYPDWLIVLDAYLDEYQNSDKSV